MRGRVQRVKFAQHSVQCRHKQRNQYSWLTINSSASACHLIAGRIKGLLIFSFDIHTLDNLLALWSALRWKINKWQRTPGYIHLSWEQPATNPLPAYHIALLLLQLTWATDPVTYICPMVDCWREVESLLNRKDRDERESAGSVAYTILSQA